MAIIARCLIPPLNDGVFLPLNWIGILTLAISSIAISMASFLGTFRCSCNALRNLLANGQHRTNVIGS